MDVFKQGLFALLLNLKPFFVIAYPMLLGLSLLGVALGGLLMVTPSNVQTQSPLIFLGFILLSLHLVILKKYYSQILAWADSRQRPVVIHIKRGME